ncbi:MAG: hypothetical protein H6718_28255 [Polyangiaceae bacterium]|nr:hypothetical protein [Polyangiaceae bacterium]
MGGNLRRPMLAVACALLSGPALVGCGESSTESSGSGGTAGAAGASAGGSGGTGGSVEVLTTVESAIGPVAAAVGDEDTVCIFKRMQNPAGFVRNIRGHLTDGSHHMIVYVSGETEEQLEPKHCGGFSGIFNLNGGIPGLDSVDIPVFIAQQHEAELNLPSDPETGKPLGFRVEENQMLRIELHWFNTTPKAQQVTGTVEFDVAGEDEDVMESSFAFWGSTAIDIPPHSQFTTPVLFQKAMADTKGFAVTTHQHQLGTNMKIWKADGTNVSDDKLLIESTDWAEPPLKMLDPPELFDVGEGLAYQCAWDNTTDSQVGFGEGFGDEMCFLWMYYYPSNGFDLCMHFNAGSQTGVCNHLTR